MKKRFKHVLLLSGILAMSSAVAVGTISLSSCSTTQGRKLVIDTHPVKTNYKVGETFSLEGLLVYSYKVSGGLIDKTDSTIVSDFTSSIKEGTVLETAGDFEVVISKSGNESAKFTIKVGNGLVTKLKITAAPTKVVYKVGETFRTNGLIVSQASYDENGKIVGGQKPVSNYTTNPASGHKFTKEGSYLVTVSLPGCESANFTISVLTGDTRLSNMMYRLHGSKNYQFSVYNTVSTTVSQYGFHYKITANEEYYNKIEFKKIAQEESDQDKGKTIISSNGAINYDEGAYQYVIDGGVVKAGKPITSSPTWWDSQNYNTFNNYKFGTIPLASYQDKFTFTVNIDPQDLLVPEEYRTYDKTAAKNPFVASFLDLCGWSSNLIGIVSRFEVITNGFDEMEMTCYFGSYGYTRLELLTVGEAKVDTVEEYLATPDRTYDKTIDPLIDSNVIQDALASNNFVRQLPILSLTDGSTLNPGQVHFTNDYVTYKYDKDFIKLLMTDESGNVDSSYKTFPDITYLYRDEAIKDVQNSAPKGIYYLESEKTIIDEGKPTEHIEESVNPKSVQFLASSENGREAFLRTSFPDILLSQILGNYAFRYPNPVLRREGHDIFDKSTALGQSWSAHPLLDSPTQRFLVSYNDEVIEQIGYFILESDFTSDLVKEQNIVCAAISCAFDTTLEGPTNKVSSIELWLFTPQFAGFTVAFNEFGNANVDYVDAYLESISTTTK